MDNVLIDTSVEALRGKRIALLSHSHPSLSKGGAEIATYTLFVGLRELGIDVTLIVCCADTQRGRLELDDGEFAIFYDSQMYDDFYHLAGADIRRQLATIVAHERIDLLNAHHFLHTGVGIFHDLADMGVETVLTIHEFLAICHNHGQMITRSDRLLCERASPRSCNACFPDRTRQQFALRQRSFADALANVGSFVSPSHFLAKRFVEWGVPIEKMHVIENGIVKREAVSPPPLTGGPKIWKYGFFGQINPFKGIDTILDACAVLAKDKDVRERIRIVVHGNFIGQSDDFIAKFKQAIEDYPFLSYAGAYDNVIVGRLMGACDYVLAPSTWWENSPVVIQEAFEARRPVICTGIGGMAEKVVDNETGLHFARNDAFDLAAKIVDGADPALYQRLQGNLPIVLSPSDMARRYSAIFSAQLAPDEIPA